MFMKSSTLAGSEKIWMNIAPVNHAAYHGIEAFPRDRTSHFWDKLRMADAVAPERTEEAVQD
jgi:hypothetical protein